MRLTALVPALALAIAAAPALAEPQTYVCLLTQGAKEGTWISPQVVILHDPANGLVVVNDPVVMTFGGQPVAGEVKVDNDKRITFGWDVREIVATGGRKAMTMRYRGTFVKATGAFSLAAKPLGYSNGFEGRGTCDRR